MHKIFPKGEIPQFKHVLVKSYEGEGSSAVISKNLLEEPGMKIKVQYSTLIVKNLEESVAFYKDVMGFAEGYHVDLGDNGRITLMKSPDDGAFVELIESRHYEVGMYSIGTDVDDLDEVIAHMKKNGVQIELGPVKTTVGRQVFIKDPNGVNICLIEHDSTPLV